MIVVANIGDLPPLELQTRKGAPEEKKHEEGLDAALIGRRIHVTIFLFP